MSPAGRKKLLDRIHELTSAPADHELGFKLRNGLLVVRDPLRRKNGMINRNRDIAIVSPHQQPRPEDIPSMTTKHVHPGNDTQLVYRRNGPKSNYVSAIRSSDAKTPAQNVRDVSAIRKTFLPHLDKGQITSKTTAQAFDHQKVATKGLVKHYSKQGYKIDRPEMRRQLKQEENPFLRIVLRHDLTHRSVPMVRPPRGSAKQA